MMKSTHIRSALRAAFPHTLPILAGFLFLGMSSGLLMRLSGLPFYFPLLSSVFIFAGSMEFVATDLLSGAFDPIHALALTLMINARHLIYGLSMLDRYRGTGKKKIYLIFGMCDESFSINCSAEIPDGIDRGWFMFFVTLLNHGYWIAGSLLGGLVGSFLTFSTEGIGFVMTAMFVVIFLEQWQKNKQHFSALLGLGVTLLSLILFGSDSFLLPAMGVLLLSLLLFGRFETRKDGEKA